MSQAESPSSLRGEQRVLHALEPWTWPAFFRSPLRLAVMVIAAVVMGVGPMWMQIPVGVVLIGSAVTYWTAVLVRIVREFREGYRSP